MKKRSTAIPYTGNEPYIFVSYCHKDRRFVLPIIENLVRTGYRIWYDEGIDPGSEWNEIIADHLSRSSLCVAFISENAVASHNCRREITYALQKNRPLLSVFLEETILSPGIEMQLSAYQCLFAYDLKNISKCLSKIASVSAIKACLGKPIPSVKVCSPADYDDIKEENKKRTSDISDEWFTGRIHEANGSTVISNEWFTEEAFESDDTAEEGEMLADYNIPVHDILQSDKENSVHTDETDIDEKLDVTEKSEHRQSVGIPDEVGNEVQKRKKVRHRITAVIIASIAFICVIALLIIWLKRPDPITPAPPDESQPPAASEPVSMQPEHDESDRLDSDDTVIFMLHSPGHLSDAEFYRSLTVITERVRSIADQFTIEDNGNIITVKMLRADLGETPELIESTIAFIAGIGTFRIWCDASAESMELNKDEILSAIAKAGDPNIEIPDHKEWAFLSDADKNDISFIDITVTPDEAERIRDVVGSGDGLISISANDLIMDGISFFRIYIGMFLPLPGTETEFRIVTLSNGSNLIAATLMHFSLPERFNYTIYEDIIWEQPDGLTQGQYQVDSITGDSLSLLFGLNDQILEYLTDEDFDNTVSIIKRRMDAIGNPYVIGTSTFNSRNIAIKTSPERLGSDFVSLIGGSGTSTIETSEFIIFNDEDISELIINQISQDSYTIVIQLSDDIEDYQEKAAFITNNNVDLYINSVLVSSVDITESVMAVTDRKITFTRLNFVSHIEMNESSKFILDLLSEITNGERITYTMRWEHGSNRIESLNQANLYLLDIRGDIGDFDFTGFSFSGKIDDIAWGVNSDSLEDARIRKIIAEQFDGIAVHRPYGGRLNFLMDIEINDDLPQRFLETVEDIYTVCGFDDSTYLELFFINENTNIPDDRLRVIFRRRQVNDHMPDDEVGLMSYTLIISGRSFEKFINEMEYLLGASEFFKNKQRQSPT